jgi:acetolactate synthase-1/2/3 large subunit
MVDYNKDNYLASDLIADFLQEKEIKIVFGIIGSANSYIFDSITNKGYTKVIYVHHEQAAVMAAGAYYKASGKLSAAVVTAGAGAANAITGVISNWADSVPCLVISGQESTKYIKEHEGLRMIGTQGFNVSKMVSDVTKYSNTVLDKSELLKSLEEAHYLTLEGRQGPTWVDIPFDIQSAKLNKENLIKFTIPSLKETQYDIEDITKLINKAERPVILAGYGIKSSQSEDQFEALIEKLKIPVLLSWSGIDILPFDHLYNFGTAGLYGQRRANFVVQNCDLLIVLGSRLALPQTGYNINNFAPNAKIIMVNNDEGELKKYSRYDITIKDDVKNFINKLYHTEVNSYKEEWYKRCIKYNIDFPLIEETHMDDNQYHDNSYVLINQLSDLLEADDILVIGQGTPLPCGHQAFKIKHKQVAFASNGLGEMGNGIPAAIGAAFQNKKVILLDGDGSMMMNLQELQTIVGYNLPVKIIIFNNDGYLFIKHTQKMLFNGRYTGVNPDTGVTLPNFKKIANAFNIPYFNSKTNTLLDFVGQEGYGIFECFMNSEQDLIPKVKGIPVTDAILAPPLEEMSPLLSLETIKNNMVNINELSYKIRL